MLDNSYFKTVSIQAAWNGINGIRKMDFSHIDKVHTLKLRDLNIEECEFMIRKFKKIQIVNQRKGYEKCADNNKLREIFKETKIKFID